MNKINSNRIIARGTRRSFGSQRKFSLEARLDMYTKRTMTPPIKIKKRTNPNHDLELIKEEIRQIIRVWARITAINDTGWVIDFVAIDRKILTPDKYIKIQKVVY